MSTRSFSAAAALATLLALTSLGLAAAEPPAGAKPEQAAAQAKGPQTAADHEAIAKRFEDEAAQFDKEAAEHTHLAQNYRQGIGVGPKGNAASLAGHCDQIAKSLRSSAANAREMAKLHHEMASLTK